jgi:putative flippase GtrA
VTLFGLWVVQGLTIHFVLGGLHQFTLPEWVSTNAAKVLATVVSLVWNYLWYSRLVFVDRSKTDKK